ncbi:hypothetical protein [Lacticaseibacillus jixiensis]|uniref:hypothetical protein n=1 Tax=Lacticaseibacillus jixiensis TaxID=3231926 RepID=UPI0036F237D6
MADEELTLKQAVEYLMEHKISTSYEVTRRSMTEDKPIKLTPDVHGELPKGQKPQLHGTFLSRAQGWRVTKADLDAYIRLYETVPALRRRLHHSPLYTQEKTYLKATRKVDGAKTVGLMYEARLFRVLQHDGFEAATTLQATSLSDPQKVCNASGKASVRACGRWLYLMEAGVIIDAVAFGGPLVSSNLMVDGKEKALIKVLNAYSKDKRKVKSDISYLDSASGNWTLPEAVNRINGGEKAIQQ